MTTPTEFVLWLNGALDIIGDNPSPEQWASIREKMNEATGFLAKAKLLEKAEEVIKQEEVAKRKAMFALEAMKHAQDMAAQRMADQIDRAAFEHLSGRAVAESFPFPSRISALNVTAGPLSIFKDRIK